MSKILNAIFLTFILIGCGGGGDSTESPTPSNNGTPTPPPVNNIPTVNAGLDISSNELELITLNATATDSDGDALTYKWTWISGSNSSLLSDDTLTPSIQLHNTKEVSLEEFELTVTDSKGASSSDSIIITVNPVNNSPTYTIEGEPEYEEYNKVQIAVVFVDPDYDGLIIDTAIEQITGPEIEAIFGHYDTTIVIEFDAPEVSQRTAFQFFFHATDDEGGEVEGLVEFTVDNRPEQFFAKIKGFNDTGLMSCTNGFDDTISCPVAGKPNQDAEVGRDKLAKDGLLIKEGSGKSGFDFTKIDSNGQPLDSTEIEWSCVLDNNTGLIWEVKLDQPGHFRDKNTRFNWHNPYQDQNGGVPGPKKWFGNECTVEYCNTHEYEQAINDLKLCGIERWTMPTVMQLKTLVDYSIPFPGPVVDDSFFSNVGDEPSYILTWASETNTFTTNSARGVEFELGDNASWGKGNASFIRLVAQAKTENR